MPLLWGKWRRTSAPKGAQPGALWHCSQPSQGLRGNSARASVPGKWGPLGGSLVVKRPLAPSRQKGMQKPRQAERSCDEEAIHRYPMSCWQLSTSLSEERDEAVTAWRQIQFIPHWWQGCVSEVLTGMLDVLPCLPRIERVSITCDMSSHVCTPMRSTRMHGHACQDIGRGTLIRQSGFVHQYRQEAGLSDVFA